MCGRSDLRCWLLDIVRFPDSLQPVQARPVPFTLGRAGSCLVASCGAGSPRWASGTALPLSCSLQSGRRSCLGARVVILGLSSEAHGLRTSYRRPRRRVDNRRPESGTRRGRHESPAPRCASGSSLGRSQASQTKFPARLIRSSNFRESEVPQEKCIYCGACNARVPLELVR